MSDIKLIEAFGSMLRVSFVDGGSVLAYPTGLDRWLVRKSPDSPVDPGGPIGDGTFVAPFAWSTVWDYNEFRSAARPTHDGIDFGPGNGIVGGESIRAAGDGIVEFAGWGGDWFNSPGFGNLVVIDHGVHNGARLKTRYAHMRTLPAVTTSQTVSKLTHLGNVGDTGNAIGEHLHWETLVDDVPVNPRTFISTYGE